MMLGVLLAGGQARRMGGGDKCLRQLGDRPILAHVIARARPQVAALLLNANGDPARFAGFGLPVAADVIAGFAGPLAGVLTGMEWARAHRPDLAWIATFATDTPFLPEDLVARLAEGLTGGAEDRADARHPGMAAAVGEGADLARGRTPGRDLGTAARAGRADLACAASGGRSHPVFGLWPVRLAPDLRRAMTEEGVRKVDLWTARHRLAVVDFPTTPFDPFFNTNRPEDLAEAARRLAVCT